MVPWPSPGGAGPPGYLLSEKGGRLVPKYGRMVSGVLTGALALGFVACGQAAD